MNRPPNFQDIIAVVIAIELNGFLIPVEGRLLLKLWLLTHSSFLSLFFFDLLAFCASSLRKERSVSRSIVVVAPGDVLISHIRSCIAFQLLNQSLSAKIFEFVFTSAHFNYWNFWNSERALIFYQVVVIFSYILRVVEFWFELQFLFFLLLLHQGVGNITRACHCRSNVVSHVMVCFCVI